MPTPFRKPDRCSGFSLKLFYGSLGILLHEVICLSPPSFPPLLCFRGRGTKPSSASLQTNPERQIFYVSPAPLGHKPEGLNCNLLQNPQGLNPLKHPCQVLPVPISTFLLSHPKLYTLGPTCDAAHRRGRTVVQIFLKDPCSNIQCTGVPKCLCGSPFEP